MDQSEKWHGSEIVIGKRCEETGERLKQMPKSHAVRYLEPSAVDESLLMLLGLIIYPTAGSGGAVYLKLVMQAIQKDPLFTSKTSLFRREINVCLQFPTQSSLLRSQVGSLGSLSVWSQSNCEGGRSSTLQVYALCRAKAWLEQLHKGCAATKFKDVSIFFQEDNSKCQSTSCSLKIQLPQSSRASKQLQFPYFQIGFQLMCCCGVWSSSQSPKLCTMHETGMLLLLHEKFLCDDEDAGLWANVRVCFTLPSLVLLLHTKVKVKCESVCIFTSAFAVAASVMND